jgi:hypothetical protein
VPFTGRGGSSPPSDTIVLSRDIVDMSRVIVDTRKSPRISLWNRFYEDVDLLFEHDSASLSGRRILSKDGVLQTTGLKTHDRTT